MNYVVVSVALTTALWDAAARRALLDRAAAAARDAGALQVLDTTLWIMSLAELKGGTPRAAGEHIAQVRELRRAIGYDAEQVVNAAYLAWTGAPRAQVEAISDAGLAWVSPASTPPGSPPSPSATWPRATTAMRTDGSSH